MYKSMNSRIFSIVAVILLITAGTAFAENDDVNLNEYYNYTIGAGVYFVQMNGIGSQTLTDFDITQISGEIRFPIPELPIIQLLGVGGYFDYTYTGDISVTNQDWSHNYVYGGAGLGFSTRLSREFEIGFDVYGAYSQSYYTALTLDGVLEEPSGQNTIIAGVSGRIALNPSYNFSISVNPMLCYNYALGILPTDNGFSYGVGFSGSYRFGNDPDAATSTIKAIRFDNINLPFIFAAMQSYYVKNPAGTVTIYNKEEYPLEDISLSFMQPGFMDSPSPVATGIILAPGESTEVPLNLTYNNEVFTTQGITPLTGELITNYTVKGREVEQRMSVTYDLYDSSSLTWDDDRKAAAFITSQDSAVRNYSSYIRQLHRDEIRPYISSNLQFAMQVFNSLGELGILYQIDPTAPFTEMQGDTFVVDSISLPRETLKRLTGDCDDLSVLFCTMLESIGIDSALVTVPGHIFIAFNTDIPSADYKMVNPDRSKIIEVDGSIWVPVEITMIGKHSFTEAWIKAIAEYAEWESEPGRRGFYPVGDAQNIFRPVMLREADLGLQYGDGNAVITAFRKDLEALSASILKPVRSEAETKNTPKSWNSLGIAAAKLGSYSTAEGAFIKAIRTKSGYTNARLNLGSLYYIQEKFNPALDVYRTIERSADEMRISKRTLFNLYLNMSKTSYAIGENDQASLYYGLAMELDPDKAASFGYLDTGSATARASDTADNTILFFEE